MASSGERPAAVPNEVEHNLPFFVEVGQENIFGVFIVVHKVLLGLNANRDFNSTQGHPLERSIRAIGPRGGKRGSLDEK